MKEAFNRKLDKLNSPFPLCKIPQCDLPQHQLLECDPTTLIDSIVETTASFDI